MSNNNPNNDKKKVLLAYKEKILEEMQYYDKRIEEFRTNHRNNCYYDDSNSSDTEDYFLNMVDTGPEVPQLKEQQALLKTCLQATQELTNLTILQSEINVLVQDPQLEGEKPVTEPGTWQEVTAECRIDLVPFTITFYMHTPDRKFGPTSYRGLQLSLVKASHEVELNKSVLNTLKRPSDAVEVVRSYAVGYRSRRTTLAHLAKKYASSLFMEPHLEGGFVLKCANLLEILWRLENKWSPVAPFHHRMKFDLEYMDESYIKIITQAHRQLLDPAIQTDERTLLLSKIINTCLEARGPVDSESDLESKQTDVQTEPKTKDSEVMAPPKSFPKKTKKMTAKDKKINEDATKEKCGPQKRNMDDEIEGRKTKKVKTAADSGAKKNLKSKEKGPDKESDDAKKKDENNAVDNEEIKKKANDTGKNVKNSDKGKQTNKKTIQKDQVEVATKKSNIVNSNENNKNTANVAKKRKNNDNVSEVTEIIKKDNKELKKTRSNEELKRKNVPTDESEPKKVKSTSDVNKLDKQILNKNKIDNRTNKPKNKIRDEGNEEVKRKNVHTGESDPKKVKSTTDVKKIDEQILNNKITDNVTNKPKSKIRDEGNSKGKKNNINDNKESDNTEATTKVFKENTKSVQNNDVSNKKVDRKIKMSIANDKKFDLITKKISGNTENKNVNKISKSDIKTVASSNNATENKKSEIITDKKEAEHQNNKINDKKSADNVNSAATQNNINKAKLIETNTTKGLQTVRKFTEKNANNIKNKEKNINVNNAVRHKIIKDKPTTISNKPEKIVHRSSTPKDGIINKKLPKITTKSIRNIIHKSPNTRHSLKIQNSQNIIKTKNSNGSTQVFSGSTEKENGGKISKIPQKKMSFNTDKILQTNIFRISPRRLPTNIKSISQDTNSKQLTKTTNIPRFMKKTVPKVSK